MAPRRSSCSGGGGARHHARRRLLTRAARCPLAHRRDRRGDLRLDLVRDRHRPVRWPHPALRRTSRARGRTEVDTSPRRPTGSGDNRVSQTDVEPVVPSPRTEPDAVPPSDEPVLEPVADSKPWWKVPPLHKAQVMMLVLIWLPLTAAYVAV